MIRNDSVIEERRTGASDLRFKETCPRNKTAGNAWMSLRRSVTLRPVMGPRDTL